MFYWFVIGLCYLPIKFFYPTKVIGKENLIKKEASILAINHQSNLDAIILGVNVPLQISFLGKAELFKNRLFAWFFTKMQIIKVNRERTDLKAVKTTLKKLKEGKTIGVFPSGTRKDSVSDVTELKNGVSMFAIKSDCHIVPIVFLKKPRFLRRNKIIIGKPFKLEKPEGKLTKEVLTKLSKTITINLQQLLTNKGEK